MIRLNDLRISYRIGNRTIEAVNGVTLTIPDGCVVGVAGESGCGKSTLMKAIYGDIRSPMSLSGGSIEYGMKGADGRLLVLQLPESKVFTHLRAAQEFQTQVAGYGVRVGLEQFGVGLNSFQLLSHFNADLLKIDRSFMDDLAGNPDHQARVREIADKARELGKTTIAEFVQDAGSMSFLFGAGIDYAQGNFLAPPGPNMDYEF